MIKKRDFVCLKNGILKISLEEEKFRISAVALVFHCFTFEENLLFDLSHSFWTKKKKNIHFEACRFRVVRFSRDTLLRQLKKEHHNKHLHFRLVYETWDRNNDVGEKRQDSFQVEHTGRRSSYSEKKWTTFARETQDSPQWTCRKTWLQTLFSFSLGNKEEEDFNPRLIFSASLNFAQAVFFGERWEKS